MKIVSFTGGGGTITLQNGLDRLLDKDLTLTLITNCYDNGLSTGEVRKNYDGKILGPSDLRKNQEYAYGFIDNSPLANLIKGFLFKRIDLNSKDASFNHINEMLLEIKKEIINNCSFNEEDKTLNLNILDNIINPAVDSFFSQRNIDLISFNNFSIANMIYAGLAGLNNFSLATAGKIMAKEVFRILEDRVLLISDVSLYLQAFTKSGKLLLDEAIIVKWDNEDDPIVDIRLVNNKNEEVIPEISNEVLEKIKEADIITFGPGTQWSSLIPTYKHKDFKKIIKESKALKFLIMNNVQDSDMKGINAGQMQHILNKYLPLEDIITIVNSNAHESMRKIDPSFKYIETALTNDIITEDIINDPYSLTIASVHNGDLLAKIIIRNYYTELINKDKIIFDFDGTLVSRYEDSFINESRHNLEIIYKNPEFSILTGNSVEHINKQLKKYCNTSGDYKNELFCDGGNSKCVWDNKKREYIFSHYLTNKYVLTNDQINEIYNAAVKCNIPVYKFENRNNVIISFRRFKENERIIKAKDLEVLIGDKYEIKLNGRSTIDIMHKGYSKLVIFEYNRFKDASILFVGDELEKGNDSVFREVKTTIVYDVNNPHDTLKLLKLIS